MAENKLGVFIKKLRKDLNLSQKQLAEKTKLARSYISRLEDNQFDSPSAMVLIKLASALRISHEKLFEVAGYVPHMEQTALPAFDVYMKTKYPDLPNQVIAELDRLKTFLEQEYKRNHYANAKTNHN